MKKESKHIVTEEEIKSFNKMREKLSGEKFTWKEMLEHINKWCAFPKTWCFLKTLIDGTNPPIVKLEKGSYIVNTKPVYKERLQTCWDAYSKHLKEKTDKALRTKTDKKKEEQASEEEEIQRAINLLKSKGYRIQKSEIVWNEV